MELIVEHMVLMNENTSLNLYKKIKMAKKTFIKPLEVIGLKKN